MSVSLFIIVALAALIPVFGLKGSLPYFIATNPETSPWFITVATIIGDMGAVFFTLWFLPKFTEWVHSKGSEKLNHFIIWLHDFFIKSDRITYLLLTFLIVNLLEWFLIFEFSVKNKMIYLGSLLINIIIVFLIFITTKKAKALAQEEKNIINWFYEKVHQKHSKRFYRWGSLALVIIVGTPVPGGGSWSGAILAFLFNIPYWRAAGLIFIGIVIAAISLTLITTGVIDFVHWL